MEISGFQSKKILNLLKSSDEWKLYKFSDALVDDTRNATKIKKEDYLEYGKYPIIDQGQKYISGYSNDDSGLYELYPSIVFGDHTRAIKYIDCPIYLGADGVKLLRCNIENTNMKYIYYFLRTVSLPNDGYSRHFKYLKEIIIPIPSLEQQERIVSILERAESAIQKRKESNMLLDKLVKSKFIEMFGSPATNPKGWEVEELSKSLVNIENGKSFVCENYNREGIYPAILKLSAVTYGVYNSLENKSLIDRDSFVEKTEVKAGDLLFTRKNTPELVGMSAYVYETTPNLMMPDLIFRLNTNENCNKIYLWKLINHDLFREKIKSLSNGSAKSMSNISKERLMKLKIPVPPIELQNEFADFVKQVDKLKLNMEYSLKELENNFNSLMQRAFNGELF